MRNTDREKEIEIGRIVHELRLMRGMSRKEIAKEIGVTQQQLQKYEKGENKISVSRLIEIALVLDLPIDAIMSEILLALSIKEEAKSPKHIESDRLIKRLMKNAKSLSYPILHKIAALSDELVGRDLR